MCCAVLWGACVCSERIITANQLQLGAIQRHQWDSAAPLACERVLFFPLRRIHPNTEPENASFWKKTAVRHCLSVKVNAKRRINKPIELYQGINLTVNGELVFVFIYSYLFVCRHTFVTNRQLPLPSERRVLSRSKGHRSNQYYYIIIIIIIIIITIIIVTLELL